MPTADSKEHRALRHLSEVGRDYPKFQDQYTLFRQDREALGGWPEYVYCPLAGAYAVVSGGGNRRVSPEKAADISRVGALAAWRPTKQIYRFDPDLFDALWHSPLAGALPCELLRRMPAWGLYIEGGEAALQQGLHGFYAHLEFDPNHAREELRLLMDFDHELLPIPLHLGAWDLETALDEMAREARRQAVAAGAPSPGRIGQFADTISPLVSLVLYLCSDEADYARPAWPQPTRTRRGSTLFAAHQPVTLEVGTRIGAALRAPRHDAGAPTGESSGRRAAPIGHVRSAHWHAFLRGPRDGERERFVKWLPPIGVNLALDEDVPLAVVRPVRQGSGSEDNE
jgi:hypothetical protein